MLPTLKHAILTTLVRIKLKQLYKNVLTSAIKTGRNVYLWKTKIIQSGLSAKNINPRTKLKWQCKIGKHLNQNNQCKAPTNQVKKWQQGKNIYVRPVRKWVTSSHFLLQDKTYKSKWYDSMYNENMSEIKCLPQEDFKNSRPLQLHLYLCESI